MRGQSDLGVGYGMEAFSPSGHFEWTGWRNYAPVVVAAVQPSTCTPLTCVVPTGFEPVSPP